MGEGRKDGNVLFNDALNTFTYSYMVKDHTDSERRNPLLPHRLLFPIGSMVLLYTSSNSQDNTYKLGTLARTRNSSMCSPRRIDPTTHHTRSEHSFNSATSRSCGERNMQRNITYLLKTRKKEKEVKPQLYDTDISCKL